MVFPEHVIDSRRLRQLSESSTVAGLYYEIFIGVLNCSCHELETDP